MDTTNGAVYLGHSAELTTLPTGVTGVLPDPSFRRWTPWNCAEVAAAAKGVQGGAVPDDLMFYVVRTTSCVYMPPCANCSWWIL
ncbi:MAG: hypothetical protein JWO56_3543 [Acidobacteria bacterium]|nr:hypothetical protein [Acidobacteriota bacterium]MEA2210064.1 hypothetical protein [Solirubrobacteraceae bacterium]